MFCRLITSVNVFNILLKPIYFLMFYSMIIISSHDMVLLVLFNLFRSFAAIYRKHQMISVSSLIPFIIYWYYCLFAVQKLIFDRPEPGVRKIVLATNLAETSITINDVVFVVDCGKAKETSYDALNNTPCLLPTWISKASARQVFFSCWSITNFIFFVTLWMNLHFLESIC